MMVAIVVIILFAGTPDPNAVFLKVSNHLADEDVSGVRCCSGGEGGGEGTCGEFAHQGLRWERLFRGGVGEL